jgi:hypothetical protein
MTTPKRSTPKKSTVRKSTTYTARKAAPKKSASKKSASKKSAPKKSAPKKSVPKKSAPKKSAPKKSVPKKSAAKKAAPKESAVKRAAPRKSSPRETAAPVYEEPTTYTLSELVDRFGSATEAEIFACVTGDRAGLIADGAEVATSRIETDCARLYGLAGDFYEKADGRQKQALRGFSEDLLRMAAFAARRGQELAEARRLDGERGADRQAQRQGAAYVLRQSAVARRDQLAALLRLASGGNAELLADIERRIGRIASPELLAQALSELGALGRRFLKSGDAALRQRAASAGLDAAFLDDTEALARRVPTELKAAAAARESSPVAQSEVDLWDGVNLFLLERILELFEVARAIEPTVPRLLPISLRGWFGRAVKSRAPNAPPAPPTP